MRRSLTTLGLLLGLTSAAFAADAPQISNPWSRATPGTATPGVAYLTITSPVADTLTGANTPIATSVELHETITTASGVGEMHSLDKVDLPAATPVIFDPNGKHLMLIGLKSALKSGDHYPLTLNFTHAGAVTVDVKITDISALTAPAPSMKMDSMPGMKM